MPYAQQHYPFERKDELDSFYPADFIAEGLDQTRGWFYTLMVLGTCIFGKSPYKNVVVSGLILAEDGKKMSKRLKNYPDPTNIITTYGADALRLYLIASPVVRAENLRFSESGVRQVLRDLLIPWWNAYSFFVTYANIDNWYEDEVREPDSDNELDRWIVSSLETLIANVTDAMDRYDLQKSVRPFLDFIDNLTNWYIRRSRRRFWKSSNDADKRHAYRTLRYVLLQLSKIAAPFTPFIAEAIYRNLRSPDMPESVHLCEFPTANAAARDAALEARMATAQLAVRLGHNLRKQKNLKVRQPLARAVVVCADPGFASRLAPMAPVIADELNVKAVEFAEDESRFVSLRAKANFKVLGAKLGPRMKAVSAAIVKLSAAQLAPILSGKTIEVDPADGKGTIVLGAEEILIAREEKAGLSVVNEGTVTIALDTVLTPELTAEGIARECVSSIQNLRKESGFEVTQRIEILVQTDEEAASAIQSFADYVKSETLGVSLSFVESIPETATSADLNGHAAQIRILPATTA